MHMVRERIAGWNWVSLQRDGCWWCGTLNGAVESALSDAGALQRLNVVSTKKRNPKDKVAEMAAEYDFSKGVRGKHARAYRTGHSVKVTGADGSVDERHFTLEDGAVMIDPDLKKHFPTSAAVNKALRSIVRTK